jgi:hypothetical protein
MVLNEYLVNHGRTAFLGRFLNRSGGTFARDDRVVVRSSRGLEIGIVLSEAAPDFSRLVSAEHSGELLRPMTAEDERRQSEQQSRLGDLLREAQTTAEVLTLPITILDAEILLDGQSAILQVLSWQECDPTLLCEHLSQTHAVTITIHEVRQQQAEPAEPESKGCGKSDCGSAQGGCSSCGTGGGCSTGSCSRGKVKDARELTAYFAGLRTQMENDQLRVPLHR